MKDFNKEYLIQTIVVASNNLRMNSDKIECVSIIKDFLLDDYELERKISYFKKLTELSKFGIKLGEIHNCLINNKIDFLTLSDNFKQHSHLLITVLSSFLDNITSQKLKEIINNFYNIPVTENKSYKNSSANDYLVTEQTQETDYETDRLKEEIILGDLSKDEELDFESFQRRILKPVKSIENLLQRMKTKNYSYEEIISYSEILNEHFELSKNIGSLIISEMHKTISKAFLYIHEKKIQPNDYVIESLRACLIVIVATIKNKAVDITKYLNLAEEFSNKIKNLSEDV
jgi:hypothetical protein